MLGKYNQKCSVSQDKSARAVTAIQRQLCQRYGVGRHHAALIAEMQGYRSAEAF